MIRLFSRSKIRAANNLGVIEVDPLAKCQQFRDPTLELYDAYYENRQYDSKFDWEMGAGPSGGTLSPREKKPRFKIAFAKSLSQRVTSKLIGASVFPNFNIDDSPDDQAFVRAVVRESKLKAQLLEPIRRMINTGSCFVRFFIDDGAFRVEWYNAKFCYPTFQANGELALVTIKYVYPDPNDKDELGAPKMKWFKMDLGMMTEVVYSNPDYNPNVEPAFTEVSSVEHGLGFVQGEWFRTCAVPGQVDGYAMVSDLTDFIDELCYSLSQSSSSVSYNQDPQVTLNGLNDDEMGDLVRSASKSWNLGREGKAGFLESNLTGVERAIELRDKIRLNIQDISRIVLLDPDKLLASANSGKALEIMHGPLKDLIDELRLVIEDTLKNLVLKMCMAVLLANKQGIEVPIDIPAGYQPETLGIDLDWPPIFQQTMDDLAKKVTVAVSAHTGRVISQATAVKFVAKDFGVEDVEAELAAIAQEPPPNPFGGF